MATAVAWLATGPARACTGARQRQGQRRRAGDARCAACPQGEGGVSRRGASVGAGAVLLSAVVAVAAGPDVARATGVFPGGGAGGGGGFVGGGLGAPAGPSSGFPSVDDDDYEYRTRDLVFDLASPLFAYRIACIAFNQKVPRWADASLLALLVLFLVVFLGLVDTSWLDAKLK